MNKFFSSVQQEGTLECHQKLSHKTKAPVDKICLFSLNLNSIGFVPVDTAEIALWIEIEWKPSVQWASAQCSVFLHIFRKKKKPSNGKHELFFFWWWHFYEVLWVELFFFLPQDCDCHRYISFFFPPVTHGVTNVSSGGNTAIASIYN